MFQVGSVVSYSTYGVCKIEDITVKLISREEKEYFVLRPVNDVRSTVFVPTDNQILVSNMRPVLTKAQAEKIVCSVSELEPYWISDDAQRREFCRDVVKSGEVEKLICLVNMLYLRQKILKQEKKHFHIYDERYLRQAERLLNDELSYALEIPTDKVTDYIASRIEKQK